MKLNLHQLIVFTFLISTLLFSCVKSDDAEDDIPHGKAYYYISNEGAFGYGNGSISLYSPSDQTITNNAFQNVNGFGPGDVVQSLYKTDNHLFAIVNGSNKIEVTDTLLNEITSIDNISLPRYMTSISSHISVISCWGNGGELKVLNTQTMAIKDSISVGNGPEKLLVSNGKIFVCNSGGFQSDSVVSVVDIDTYNVTEIPVADNPVDVVKAGNKSLWILCQGRIIYDASWQPIGETKAALVEINPETNVVVQKVPLGNGAHPSQLEISPDKTKLYFGGGFNFSGIYIFDINTATIESAPLINKSFYGFNVEPTHGDIYCLEAPVFTSSGRLLIYNSSGNLKTEVKTGIGPNGILF